MYFIVVGAEPEGCSLLELALKDGHEVALIEKDEKRAHKVLQKHSIQVFHADIASDDILDEADAKRADVLIATTKDDSANLMTMLLGKELGIKKLISMVNQSYHQPMFEHLGVQTLVNPEIIIAQYLYEFIDQSENKS